MLENKFQANLIKELKARFPGCIVMKNDPTYIQGIPDLLVLHKDKWASLASPSEKGYSTVNDSPEAITLSWEFSTTPVEIATLIDGKKLKPTSILTFDSTKVDAKKLATLEEILYGKDPSSAEADDGVEPRLPLPDEVIKIMTAEG